MGTSPSNGVRRRSAWAQTANERVYNLNQLSDTVRARSVVAGRLGSRGRCCAAPELAVGDGVGAHRSAPHVCGNIACAYCE